MATINVTDILFATLSGCGIKGLTVRLSGVASYTHLLEQLRRVTGDMKCGLVTLTLRNSTQGWSTCRQLLVN